MGFIFSLSKLDIDTYYPKYTYTISADKTAINENETTTFTITTTNIASGTNLYWEVIGVTGTINSSDFTSAITGSVSVNNNTATFSLTTSADVQTEGTESFKVRLYTGSVGGTQVAETATITITDTSLAPTYTVSSNKSTMTENETATFTVTTTDVANGTAVYWEVIGVTGTINSSDFTTPISGSVLISSNAATFDLTTSPDITTEGTESFKIRLYTGSVGGNREGDSSTITITDTSLNPTYAISTDKTSVNENDTIVVTATTTNVANGTTLYWQISGVTGTINTSDFTTALSGSTTVTNNTATFNIGMNQDITTEGQEVFRIYLYTGSVGGTQVATSNNITVNDTSLNPTYSVTSSKSSINEGESITFDVATTGVADNTTLYWRVMGASGTVYPSDFTTDISGTINIVSSTASISVTTSADLTTEGTESFTVRLYTGSMSGPQVATSSAISIIDTSTAPAPTYAISAAKTTVAENEANTFNITTTNITDGTSLYWEVIGVTGTVNAADFTSAISGSVSVSSNAASISLTTSADVNTEGTETFKVRLYTGSVGGTQVAETAVVTITDTSLAPTYAISASKSAVNENEANTFNITTANVANGTTLYWEVIGVTGTINASDFTTAISGSVSVSSNAASFSLTTSADLTTEGTETFKVRLYTGSVGGTQVAETTAVTINDTSLTIVTDANFSRNVLLVNGDTTNAGQNNTFIDSSANNATVTKNGNVAQGTMSPFYTTWSNYFNGTTGNYLSTTYNTTAFNWWTGDCTIEAWVYPITLSSWENGTPSTPMMIGNMNPTGGDNSWSFGPVANGTIKLYYYTNATTYFITSTATISANQWSHIAMVKSGNTVALYVNGQQQTPQTLSPTPVNTASPLSIGSWSNKSINGYISNLRLVKGTAVYTTSFTPSTTPLTAVANTVLLTCQSYTIKDASTNNFAITATGTPSVSHVSPFVPSSAYIAATNGGSAYFDGTGDYLSVPATTNLAMGTGDYTIEGWFNSSAAWSTRTCDITDGASGALTIYLAAGNLRICAQGSTSYALASVTSLLTNVWYHIAVVRSSGTTKTYINGVQSGSISDTTNYTAAIVRVGGMADGYFNGYISNFRVVKGTAVYTTTFTPSTTPLTAVANTQLLLLGTNAHIADATGTHLMETVGNAQVNTTTKKFKSSVSFDGTGDYLILPYQPILNFHIGDFTIECWVYVTALNKPQYILTNRPAASSAGYQLGIDSTNRFHLDIYANNTFQTIWSQSAWTVGANTWYHTAWVKQGSTLKFYLAGTNVSTITVTGTPVAAYETTNIGCDNTKAGNFSGLIEDLRISDFARYTANFTVPTESFPIQ